MSHHPPSLGRRALLLALAVTLTLGLMAATAAAHVEIDPESAEGGTTTQVVFSPLNEESDAGTVKVLVQFPRDYPIASAVAQADAIWTPTVKTRKLGKAILGPDGKTKTAVDHIIWEGGPSPTQGSFDLPAFTIGPLPTNAKRLYFKILQTYANGHVDKWIQLPARGAPDPEFGAPVLKITK